MFADTGVGQRHDLPIQDLHQLAPALEDRGIRRQRLKRGKEEMKVVCFFAPATNLDNYKFFDDVEFPE